MSKSYIRLIHPLSICICPKKAYKIVDAYESERCVKKMGVSGIICLCILAP